MCRTDHRTQGSSWQWVVMQMFALRDSLEKPAYAVGLLMLVKCAVMGSVWAHIFARPLAGVRLLAAGQSGQGSMSRGQHKQPRIGRLGSVEVRLSLSRALKLGSNDKQVQSSILQMTTEIRNWATVAQAMESQGATSSQMYIRAKALANGELDPMPTSFPPAPFTISEVQS